MKRLTVPPCRDTIRNSSLDPHTTTAVNCQSTHEHAVDTFWLGYMKLF